MASCLSIKKGSNEKGNEGLECKTSKQVHLVESKIVVKTSDIQNGNSGIIQMAQR
jgi:hypothetical protein